MNLFSQIGNYEHNLDTKNRVFVPVKLREKLGDNFIIRVKPSKFSHVDCFTEEAFEKKVEAELSPYTNEILRERQLFKSCANAIQVSVDSQGRICINSNILKLAGLEKECLFVGVGEYIQIWNPEAYAEYYQEIFDESTAEEEAVVSENYQGFKYRGDGRFFKLNNDGE
ncbi:MAG: hypothetical protein NC122_04400 [Faecalibacterium sp.]|nr:hypothetical protein [Ruminococcus sp.]MCM1485424.1 hypothetical protein [Faecalibacterium sp.]